MSSTTALRRGKPVKAEPTVLVEDSEGKLQRPTAAMATVRRRTCGTGPFDKHWLNLDCCGLFCAFFTYMLHFYGVYTVCFVVIPPWMSYTDENGVRTLSTFGILNRAAFVTVTLLAVISHFKTMTTDPGAVPPDAKPLPDPSDEQQDVLDPSSVLEEQAALVPPKKPLRLCRRCKSYKPQRAHHCSVCARCIIRMDHHCPWVNNCVGIGNHKYFLLFVFYTFVSCCYAMFLVITRFSTCMGIRSSSAHHHVAHVTCLDRPSDLLKILGLLVESLLFGMFTSCMMFDQAGVVNTGLTHIDRLKGSDIAAALPGVVEVFGAGKNAIINSNFRMDWLSPFGRVCFPDTLRDQVMGFCRPIMCETELTSRSTAPRAVADIV